MKHCFLFKPAVPLLVAALFALVACNEPIFYTIAQEVAPIEPRIKGGPTNFVVFNDVMYVASGNTLHWYKGGEWDTSTRRVSQPGGRINSLAVTKSGTDQCLYALCYPSDTPPSSVIKRLVGTDWISLDNSTGYNVRHIYAAGPNLFISAEISNSFAVFYADGGSIAQISGIDVATKTELCGAAYDEAGGYYLCTKGGGIYYATDPESGFSQVSGTNDIFFTGIISIDGGSTSKIVAIERRFGKLYTVNGSAVVDTGIFLQGNYESTGALAIWEAPPASLEAPSNFSPGSRLLLAGQTLVGGLSAYSNGYAEVDLYSDGTPYGAFREPGTNLSGSPTSVFDLDNANDRYKSTIGRLAINYMFQAPARVDSGMTLFASTQNQGVWSYRSRKDLYQWNAED